jgi:SAM-dependent methyltransferase
VSKDFLDFLLQRTDPMIPPRRLMYDGPMDQSIFRSDGEEYLGHLIELAELRPDSTVLDVGSGIGRKTLPLTGYLSSRGSYDGLEPVPLGVDWCSRHISTRWPNFRFHQIDVFSGRYHLAGRCQARDYRFPFDDALFDVVISTSVFTHMRPDGVANYLAEISRVLKPGGRTLTTYFLVGSESRAHSGSAESDLAFAYQIDGALTTDLTHPERAIAHLEPTVRDLHSSVGLKINEPINYGTWSGTGGNSYQDIIVATRVT